MPNATNATAEKPVQNHRSGNINQRPKDLNQNRSMAHVHLSFLGSIRAELLKLFSIASTWWLSAISVLLTVGFAAMFAWSVKQESHYDARGKWMATAAPIPRTELFNCVAQSMAFAFILIGVVAILSITGEYGTSSVQMSLVVNPRRVMFMNAKAVAVAIYSFVLSLVMLLVSWGLLEAMLSGSKQTPLGSKERWLPLIVVLGGAAMVTLVAEFALGLGAMLRSTAGGVVVFIAIYTMSTSILGIIYGLSKHMQWAMELSNLMPSSLVDTFMSGPSPVSAPSQLPKGWFVPNWWQSGLLMLAWAAVFYIVGTFIVRKRDVK
ncbi:ABC transporter permease subunit [Bifidobacterium sp. ESL0784]|uniref:ABC transporter permease subunit n=1 Tax=Bifidobacterium sp. ESL0784 TaxID=2983231 RepID=UPI0023F6741C|nr:ABC transporter permease subunit [Bifidobacterium sp. ESL0784]MDF7640260.1 ABC transporter permease subunit [Bifidobacterium sp. ESL0784]